MSILLWQEPINPEEEVIEADLRDQKPSKDNSYEHMKNFGLPSSKYHSSIHVSIFNALHALQKNRQSSFKEQGITIQPLKKVRLLEPRYVVRNL